MPDFMIDARESLTPQKPVCLPTPDPTLDCDDGGLELDELTDCHTATGVAWQPPCPLGWQPEGYSHDVEISKMKYIIVSNLNLSEDCPPNLRPEGLNKINSTSTDCLTVPAGPVAPNLPPTDEYGLVLKR